MCSFEAFWRKGIQDGLRERSVVHLRAAVTMGDEWLSDKYDETEWIMYSFDSTRSTVGLRSCCGIALSFDVPPRTQKLAWASFFERPDAVFFVAPLDCFDEWSDDNENELKHSMDLWGGVVRNEMLCKAPLVLVHNKINLLREKLETGTRIADHVVSFKNRLNDVDTAVRCRRSPILLLRLRLTEVP